MVQALVVVTPAGSRRKAICQEIVAAAGGDVGVCVKNRKFEI
jgi:hypothetical protein